MNFKRLVTPLFLSLSVSAYLFVNYFKPINAYTQDLGRHLVTGKIITETLIVPRINLFSYTNTSFPFINHHFLSEVVIYLTYSVFGNNGLQILTLILVMAAFGLVFFYSSVRYSFLIASITSFLYLGILFERTDIRPELFSFLFLSIFIVILFKNRTKETRLIYLLPIILLLWVNMHIYFFVGIVVLTLFVIDAFFQRRETFKKLCIILCLSVVAILINPNFINGALYPLKVFNNYGYTIEENQTVFLLESLGFEKASVTHLKIATFLLFLIHLLNFRRVRLIDWLLSIVFTYAAFMAVRNLPLFVFATFIPISKSLFEISQGAVKLVSKKYAFAVPLLVIIVIGSFIWETSNSIAKNRVGFGVTLGAERGMDFFLTQKVRGPVFNNFDIGSYLIYGLYPKEKVFIDGRPEAYPAEFIKNKYIRMQENVEVFETMSKEYNFQSIFFTHTDMTPWSQKFISEVVKNKKWQTVYLDDTSIILVKTGGVNKEVGRKFGTEYPNFKESPSSGRDMQSLLKLANFYQSNGSYENQIESYKKILSQDPKFCPAIYNMAILLSGKDDISAQVFAQRYKVGCQNTSLGQY